MPTFREGDATRLGSGPGAHGAVRTHLAAILNSLEFQRSDRSRILLEFLVEAVLRGEGASLKESVIGVKVFHRPADYDPKIDPVVRVAAGRLRDRLEAYYSREGANEPIRIVIPRGTYIPGFEQLAPIQAPSVRPAPFRSRTAVAVYAALAAAVLIGAGWWLQSRPRPQTLDQLHPLLLTGSPNNVAFSPAADAIALDAEEPGDRYRNIYIQRLDADAPRRLTRDENNARSPVWSPDGSQLAFLRAATPAQAGVFLIRADGSGERKLMDLGGPASSLNWSNDGQWLISTEQEANGSRGVVRISVRSGDKVRLTNPPPDWRGDAIPAFSHDSRLIAFRRTTPRSGEEDIYTVSQSGGAVTRLTFDGKGISGLAFLPDNSLLFSSRRGSAIRGLWWITRNGTGLTRLTPATMDAGPPAVSRDGRHVALVVYNYDTNIWRVPLDGSSAALPLIASEVVDSSPQYSPDGSRIAFCSERSGTGGIWISDANGKQPARLVDGKGASIGSQHWSPDGRQIVFEWHPAGKAELYVVAAAGGTPRALLADGYDNSVPVWSRDGGSVYFDSTRTGRPEIWKIPATGGSPVQITRQGAVVATESPDGGMLFFLDFGSAGDSRSLWRVPLSQGLPAGEAERVLGDLKRADWSNWALTKDGICHIRRAGDDVAIEYLDFATGRTRRVYDLQRPPAWGGGLTLSPDGRWVLFTQVDRDGSSIFVQ